MKDESGGRKKVVSGQFKCAVERGNHIGEVYKKKHSTYQNPIFISSDCILYKVDQVRGNISKIEIMLNVSHKLNIIPVRKTTRAPFIQLSHHSISTITRTISELFESSLNPKKTTPSSQSLPPWWTPVKNESARKSTPPFVTLMAQLTAISVALRLPSAKPETKAKGSQS